MLILCITKLEDSGEYYLPKPNWCHLSWIRQPKRLFRQLLYFKKNLTKGNSTECQTRKDVTCLSGRFTCLIYLSYTDKLIFGVGVPSLIVMYEFSLLVGCY